jgi:hypothetical protein
MPRDLNAVGVEGQPSHRVIFSRVLGVESRVDALEKTINRNRETARRENVALQKLMEHMLERLGAPEEGGQEATGVYWAIDKVSKRVRPFERRFDQFKGGVKAITFAAVPVGALIWFLDGHRLSTLLGG